MRFVASHVVTLGLLSLGAACGSSRAAGSDSDGGSGASAGAGRGGAAAGGGSGGTNAGSGAGGTSNGGTNAGSGGSAANCGGSAPRQPGQVGETPTYEAVQCYVSAPTAGGAACLPPSDASLVTLLRDHISSVGFAVSFVIDSAETIPLPDACEPFVQCCDAFAQDDLRQAELRMQCYDRLDSLGAEPVDGCPAFPPDVSERFECAGSGGAGGGSSNPGEGGAAGASDVPTSHVLCCYRTCGFTRYL